MFNLTNTQELVDFLSAKKITPNQALFCHLIHTDDMKELYRYIHEVGPFSEDEVTDLEDRGYIINQDHHSRTKSADMFVVTERLLDGLNLVDSAMGEEFWNAYPSYIVIKNLNVPAKSTDKDVLIRDYTRIVKSPDTHVNVIRSVNYAKKFNLITMGIRKWVDSRQWEMLLPMLKDIPKESYGEQEF